MKFKPGDEVLVKAEITDIHECTDKPYFVMPNFDSVDWVSEDKIIPMGKTYTQGLADAWELVRKLGEIEQDEREKMFSYRSVKAIIEDCTIEEVKDRIEAYEKKKEIKVGDVLESKDEKRRFLVVTEEDDDSIYEFGVIDLKTMTLDRICNYPKGFIKTGKHIDIESLLRQIGE